jgi:hypothetical protein
VMPSLRPTSPTSWLRRGMGLMRWWIISLWWPPSRWVCMWVELSWQQQVLAELLPCVPLLGQKQLGHCWPEVPPATASRSCFNPLLLLLLLLMSIRHLLVPNSHQQV